MLPAQLIETTAGTHIWADRFDGSLDDVFELQDRIAESAAAIIEPKLRSAEVEKVRRKPPQNVAPLSAQDLTRGISSARNATRGGGAGLTPRSGLS